MKHSRPPDLKSSSNVSHPLLGLQSPQQTPASPESIKCFVFNLFYSTGWWFIFVQNYLCTDCGHKKAKSLIIWSLNQIKYLGCEYKGLVFFRNNGCHFVTMIILAEWKQFSDYCLSLTQDSLSGSRIASKLDRKIGPKISEKTHIRFQWKCVNVKHLSAKDKFRRRFILLKQKEVQFADLPLE